MTLSKHILVVLARVAPAGLTAGTLRDELEIRVQRRPGESEIDDALFALRKANFVTRETDALTQDARYVITGEGAKQ